jgi:hypothetical protein
MGHGTFQVGDLTATIGDNAEHEQHRAGYNGVWELRHRAGTESLFVPTVAGLNFEHIFDGQASDERDVFFEPRVAPMTFRRLSDHEAELHQPPTATFHLESWTRFALCAPHYLDMQFRCVAQQHVFQRGYIGLFWASYINAPDDKSMYFRGGLQGQGGGQWMQLCTPAHNNQSTVRHHDDGLTLSFRDGYRDALFRNFSPMRYDLPMFYGNVQDLVWIVMFDRACGPAVPRAAERDATADKPPQGCIRLTHSPSGGGYNAQRQTTNPAWDFQYLISPYDVMQPYEFRVRTVLRPRCSRSDVLAEYQRWQEELKR